MSLPNALTSLLSNTATFFSTQKAKIELLFDQLKNHVLDVTNPHRVDKFDVGLSKVQNQAPATPEQAAAGKHNNTVMSPLRTDQYMETNVYDPMITALDDILGDLNS